MVAEFLHTAREHILSLSTDYAIVNEEATLLSSLVSFPSIFPLVLSVRVLRPVPEELISVFPAQLFSNSS